MDRLVDVGHNLSYAVMVFVILFASGCGLSDPPRFAANLEGRDTDSISLNQKSEIDAVLADLFGTPDVPLLPSGVERDMQRLLTSAGPPIGGEGGSSQGLFRQHCAECHGINGDGIGPVAGMLNPYPRNFQKGLFKFTRTRAGAKPVRDDLRRTLHSGIAGTAMPSFEGMSNHQIEAILEYVIYLSLRGETEQFVVQLIVDEDEYTPLDRDWVVEDGALLADDSWRRVEENPGESIVDPPTPPPVDTLERLEASIARGRALYESDQTQCTKCHGLEGRGDGEEAEIYDDWNKPKVGVTPEKTRELASRFILPLQRLRPRDFTTGNYRGGSRPVDLYWRIHVGIKGTPMPAAGPSPGVDGLLSEMDIWHVVHYIRSLQ